MNSPSVKDFSKLLYFLLEAIFLRDMDIDDCFLHSSFCELTAAFFEAYHRQALAEDGLLFACKFDALKEKLHRVWKMSRGISSSFSCLKNHNVTFCPRTQIDSNPATKGCPYQLHPSSSNPQLFLLPFDLVPAFLQLLYILSLKQKTILYNNYYSAIIITTITKKSGGLNRDIIIASSYSSCVLISLNQTLQTRFNQ